MNDDDKQARFEHLIARARAKLATDPAARDRAMLLVATTAGVLAASRDIEVHISDGVPDDIREAFAEGYVGACMVQVATAPKWYADIPLLGRLVKMARNLHSRKRGGA